VSELNRMRREVVHELEKLRSRPKRWTLRTEWLNELNRLNELNKLNELIR